MWGTIDPSERHILTLDITVPEDQEKVFLGLGFRNDFGMEDVIATIKLDQFSKPNIGTNERRYAFDVDLNQMYAFALSERVSALDLILTTPGSYVLHGYQLRSSTP